VRRLSTHNNVEDSRVLGSTQALITGWIRALALCWPWWSMAVYAFPKKGEGSASRTMWKTEPHGQRGLVLTLELLLLWSGKSNHIPAQLAHGKPDFLVEIFETVASLDMANPVPHTPD
jgi:hypothetical protein